MLRRVWRPLVRTASTPASAACANITRPLPSPFRPRPQSIGLSLVSTAQNAVFANTTLRVRVPFVRSYVATSTSTTSSTSDATARSSISNAATAKTRVLIFDVDDGEPTIHALTRSEVLRITQDAAFPGTTRDATPFGRTPSGTSGAASPRGRGSGGTNRSLNFDTIVDVQRVHARDIRQLDSAFAVRSEPSVEVRDQAILFNTDPIRAIIMRDRCLVFVREDDVTLRPLLKDVFRELAGYDDAEVTYEFQALEALLGALCRYYHGEFDRVAPAIAASLNKLTSGQPTTGELNTLRAFKNTMNEFQSRIDGVRRALMFTLNNEEDLRLLYLSKLYADRSLLGDLWSFDSEEAEVLIENYLQDIYAMQTHATLLQQRITNTETVVKLRLDAMRNYLLGVNILFSVAGISLSLGTFVVGVFGMNLISGLEETSGLFVGVTALSTVIMGATGVVTMRFFRRKGIFGSVQNFTDKPTSAAATAIGMATTTATTVPAATAVPTSAATKKALTQDLTKG